MTLKTSIVRIGTNLMMLAIFSGAASSSENHHPESSGVAVSSACDFNDCVQVPESCQVFCALLFNRTAGQSLSLALQQNDYSVTGIAVPTETVKGPLIRKAATNGKWAIRYTTAVAQGTQPSGTESAAPSGPATVTSESPETPQSHWSHLPIWGAEAEAKGYRIPLPFGAGVSFYDARQPVNVRDLKLGVGSGPTESAAFVKVGRPIVSWQQNVSSRFDVWLLPFLNVYGVFGYTRGNTRGRVTVTGPVAGLLNEELPLLAEFNGPTVGGGITLAFGHKIAEWRDLTAFIIGDVNHTVTYLSFKNESLIAHTKPQATVAAPRVGLRGAVTEYIHAGMWVGGMYQLIQEEVAGSVAGRQLEFIINQRAAAPWNTLVGGQIEFGKHFNVIIEGGFGDRSSILTGLTFRF